ncbi:uncharacterized protein LOC109817899 isoform X2 [Cajanus cajan]|uniref:uncharacterized protein LOC109817899 isoform X2 n=1 Tax=Cajanus cajan TaxID=3821 RepID=UPI00098DBC9C|nr:uncharacterized protein LOC109817899 isoform X2 [Cajanus cajan]
MLKELKEKHDEEMNLMNQNQDRLLLELSFIRKFMYKHFPMELSMPQKFNGSSFGQVFVTNIGQEKVPEMPHMSFGTHESQLPTKSTTNMKIESQSTKIPTVIMKSEANKNNMVQADDLTSLLKLLRKDNDEAVRILAAKAIANLSMNDKMVEYPLP